MSVRPITKKSTLANVTSENKGDLKSAAIFTVDIDGRINNDSAGVFLLNPSAIQDSKSANWAQQQVPGQSDPILQWTSSGPRVLSFQALVTADTSNYVSGMVTQPGKPANDVLKSIPYAGRIAASFSKLTVPNPRQNEDITPTSLDISSYLDYYRSLLYPTYSKGNHSLDASPPLVVLYMGSSIAKVQYGDKITTNTDIWVVTNVEIQINKFLPNLAPMEATVNFQLTQYTIKSLSRDRFLK